MVDWVDLIRERAPGLGRAGTCPVWSKSKYNALSGIIQTLFPLFPGKMMILARGPGGHVDAGADGPMMHCVGADRSDGGFYRKNAEKSVIFLLTSPETVL